MKVRLCDELEAAWTTIQNQLSAGATPNYIYKTGDIEVVIEPRVVAIVRLSAHYLFLSLWHELRDTAWTSLRRCVPRFDLLLIPPFFSV